MPSALTHATFCVERVYDAAPARVFHAFTDREARMRWFFKTDSWTLHDHSGGELGVGRTESSRFSPPGADVIITNDSIYLDVAPNERVIFAYAMTLGGAPLSSSLSTVEFRPEGKGTRIVFTEQGVYLDGNVDGRIEGTEGLLTTLGEDLARG
ncbi:MAG TPA: SRPBCC family protein [Caulobacter sp.]|nr:SRPBCC family protein [Caulobacter sp.]